MTQRLPILGVFIMLLTVGLTIPTGAEGAGAQHEMVVAVIDTGTDARHQEFDYQGPNSSTDQIVAWWDFTAEHKSISDTDPFSFHDALWDVDIPDPFDGNGHGTATASLVGGLNRGGCPDAPKESHAPGVKLAIAKVSLANGTTSGSLALAIRWATDIVHADVISLSIGPTLPTPNLEPATYDALRHAREAGVLPVVLAHNGVLGMGLAPYPSWAGMYGSSPDVFIVGGGSHEGDTLTSTTGNDDPDVSSWSDLVCVAKTNTKDGYVVESGTSLATPLVAGMAARAKELALANGHNDLATPEGLAMLLKHCARDTAAPYAREGWGFLEAPEMNGCVALHAAAGTLPAYQSYAGIPVNTNEAYDEAIRANARAIFSADPFALATGR
jgi:subtilisin family serine protease